MKSKSLQLLFLLLMGSVAWGASQPEMPGTREATEANGVFTLNWDTVAGQGYQVERSDTLASESWLPAEAWRTGDGSPMSFSESLRPPQAFYRISVAAEDFEPAELSPQWQIDATVDFPALADGSPVSKWNGAGIASLAQDSSGSCPIYSAGSVVFDGIDDFLPFPMWQGGVGDNWTLALLLKVGEGVGYDRTLFGGDIAANRTLTFAYRDGGLDGYAPGYRQIAPPEYATFSPNDNWKVLILRSDGSEVKVTLDWYEESFAGSGRPAQTGNFHLGSGWNPPLTASPVTIRYASFFPTCLNDEDIAKMARWLERKKGGEYPPVALFYGGGQSNYLAALTTLRKELVSSFGNTAFAFGSHYGSRPLTVWERDNDAGTGYEVCPYYDLSAAPAGSKAAALGPERSGTRVISDWKLRATTVKKHPKSLAACIFVQGESDTGDARTVWKANGNGAYNATYANYHDLSESYGARSAAWNAAVQEQTGHPDMFFIYEIVSFAPDYPLAGGQVEGLSRHRKSLFEACRTEPRRLLVDTNELPRADGVHFSRPEYAPTEIPNTGAERFARATARLLAKGPDLATLDYDARMLAMRAIDSGMELDAAKLQACTTLTAHPLFPRLYSLVIPTLPAANAVDQERLRRCNLLTHTGNRYNEGFRAVAPAKCQAACEYGTDVEALRPAISQFLEAWGVAGEVEFAEDL